MATLTSASTLAEIKAAYAENASYAEDGSAAKARAFITACRLLLLYLPKRASSGARSEEIELDLERIEVQIRDAKQWLAVFSDRAAAAPVTLSDFSCFRD